MIKYDKIKIKLAYKNLGYYRKLYGLSLKKDDIIEINILDLPLNSREKILVVCDKCGIEKSIRFMDYMRREKVFGTYYCKNCKGESIKNGCKRIYGVDNVFQLSETKEKGKETCLKKYGYEYPLQNPEILQKQIDTNQRLYGIDFQMQNPENIKKSKITCKEKYGGESNMSSIEILEKCYLSALRIKKYRDTTLYYQGSYEKDFLDKYYDKLTIERGPSIIYDVDKIYYSDFYIKELNLIIEIKSTYWYNKHKDMVLEKENACKINNYNYMMILNKNYK